MIHHRSVIVIGSGPAGHTAKVTGPDLMKAFRDQSIRQGVDIRTEDVNEVDLSQRPFTLSVGDDDEQWTCDTLIITTGAQAKWLNLPSEDALKGRGC